jgi:vitamin B12 transporter
LDENRFLPGATRLLALLLTPAMAFAQDVEPPAEAAENDDSDLQDAIVVVAKRFEQPVSESVASVTRLGRDDIERRQATQVDDMLREVPGVQVVRDGPAGQFSRLFVRGAASNQTLVVIDGIPQNDATTGGGYDLNDLGTGAVESIEVLRGSYGVLYGSEAIGGVVDVTTRRGREEPGGFVRLEGGSFDTHREAAGVNGTADLLDFALSASNFHTHGERSRQTHRASDVTSRLGYEIDPELRLEWTGRYVDSKTESPFDFASSGVLPEDDNIRRRRETFSTGLGALWDPDPDFTVRAHASYLNVDSDFRNGPDAVELVDPDFTPGSGDEVRVLRKELDSRNDQTDTRLRLDGTWRAGNTFGWGAPEEGGVALDVTAGGETLSQDSDSRTTFPDFAAPTSTTQRIDDTARTKSLFAQADLRLPDAGSFAAALVTVGARNDDHSEAGDETSPFFGGRVDLVPTDTTFRASYGEGFRAPKPSELLDPFVGNLELTAETSESREIGIEQRLLDRRVVVGVTWFELEVEDLIAFDPDFSTPERPFGALRNFGKARTRGTEWSGLADVGSGFTLRASYTRQDPEDRETGLDLPNRVRWFGSLGVAWEDGPFLVSLDGYFSRKLHDQGGEFTYPEPGERRRPGEMKLVNLAARWTFSEELTFFARVENLLDDDYVATPSSPAGPPLAVYVGAQWDF